MIVKATGISLEEVPPRGDGPRPTEATAGEWLVFTADRRLRAELAEAVGRRGGAVLNADGIDAAYCPRAAAPRHAFVDLVAADPGPAADFLMQLARPGSAPRPMLIVRGADGDVAGERLARRAGAIAYLAGKVRPGFLDSLIAEISP